MKKKYYLLVPILISMFFISSFFTTSQDNNDTYKIIRKIDKVEIREYKSLLYVSYHNKGVDSNQNSHFRVLADYILELDVPQEDKDMLLSLTPQSYTGVASKIFDFGSKNGSKMVPQRVRNGSLEAFGWPLRSLGDPWGPKSDC